MRKAGTIAILLVLFLAVLFPTRLLGNAGTIAVTPTSNNFGNVNLGSKGQKSFTITNSGSVSVTIQSLPITGNTTFSVSGITLPKALAAKATTTFVVTFAPTAGGAVTGTLTINSTATNALAISLSGNGTGNAAVASLSPTSLAFASQSVGTTSSAQTVTLINSGNAALTITSLGLTGTNASDFSQSNNCGSSVGAGGNCTISVMFTPSASGSRAASLSIADNASNSPQTVSLSGTGTAPVASFSSASLAFGNQPVDITSSVQTVTLTNTGNAALSITSLAITGTNAGDFAEIADTCGGSVAAGGNCTIGIAFTPSAVGQRAATLSLTDNASGSPQTVSLSGAGTHDVILSWTASTTPGVVGYDVYRGTASGGESTMPLNSSPVNGTTYCDAIVQAGQTYYYVVTAVASNDVTQSADSNEVQATVP